MDQASTLSRSRSPRPPSPEFTAAPSTADPSGSEAASDSVEEPESPGGRSSAVPLAPEGDGNGDPLAEPIAALLGAALAVVTLLVPILTVVTSPFESSSEPRVSPLPIPAVSRSRPVETVPGPAAAIVP